VEALLVAGLGKFGDQPVEVAHEMPRVQRNHQRLAENLVRIEIWLLAEEGELGMKRLTHPLDRRHSSEEQVIRAKRT
jgi:hypothetical protein